MHDIECWKKQGFIFEAAFPGEYDLWFNPQTARRLRLYHDGRAWLTHPQNGRYELVRPPEHKTEQTEQADSTPT